MFYECQDAEGTDRLINLDQVQYFYPDQYGGQPATAVVFTDGKTLKLRGEYNTHLGTLAELERVVR